MNVQGFAKACALLFQLTAETVIRTVASDQDVRLSVLPCFPVVV